MTTSNTRRDNLRTTYLFIVDNWAVDVNDMATHLPQVSDGAITTKEQIRSLLTSLEGKGLIVGEQVNGEGLKVFQSYFDILNEDNREDAEKSFDENFPEGSVKDTKTPEQVEKHRTTYGEVVYEVKKNRVSGAHTQVIRGARSQEAPDAAKWVLRCVTHSHDEAQERRLPAEALAHHSHRWCPKCGAPAKAAKKASTKKAAKKAPKAKSAPRGSGTTVVQIDGVKVAETKRINL